MTTYSALKLIHIISASILFGTGIGTAFFMLQAYLSRNTEALKVTTRNVVLADWLFTSPAVLVQLLTGLYLVHLLNIDWRSLWFVLVISLFIFVGLCWVPVVIIQIRLKTRMHNGAKFADIQPLMKRWVALGIPAFSSMLLLYFLMVSKYGMTILLFD